MAKIDCIINAHLTNEEIMCLIMPHNYDQWITGVYHFVHELCIKHSESRHFLLYFDAKFDSETGSTHISIN